MKKKFVLPRYDVIFKSLFGNANNMEIIEDFLAAILGFEKEKIKSKVIIKNSELLKTNIANKKQTVDLLVEYNDRIINIELNNQKSYLSEVNYRNFSYFHHIIYSDVTKGEDYYKETEYIQINVDLFSLYEEIQKPILKFTYYDKVNKKEYKIPTAIYHINVAECKKELYNGSSKENRMLMWGAIIASENIEEIIEIAKGDEIMGKVVNKIEEFSADENILGLYNWEEDQEKLRKAGIRRTLEEGKALGVEKTAINFYKQGIPIEIIATSTSLPIERIEELVKDEHILGLYNWEEDQEKLRKASLRRTLEEGKALGVEKTAINLYKQGISMDVITQATSLSAKKIEELVK